MSLKNTPPIFISYGREDDTLKFVRRLHDDLESANINAWLDKEDIQPGEDWDIAIQNGLDNCRALVLVVTRKSLLSPVVRAEWNRVLNSGKAVVPLLLGQDVTYDDLPFRLQLRQGVNFQGDYEVGRAELFKFLRTLPTVQTDVDHSRAKLDELKQAQAQSSNPEDFERAIQEAQQILDYLLRAYNEPDKVEQENNDHLNAALERERQQELLRAENRHEHAHMRYKGSLPNVRNKFRDRETERGLFAKWMADSDSPMVVIVGHGGMGKTALASYVLDKLEQDYERVAGLVYLRTTTMFTLGHVFENFGSLTGQELLLKELYKDTSKPLSERIQVLLEKLRHPQQKYYVLLLDNLETIQNKDGSLTHPDLVEFIDVLLELRHLLKVIITTRIPVKVPTRLKKRLTSIQLEAGLPPHEAAAFLKDSLGVQGTNEQLQELAVRLGGYPRALEAAASYLDNPFAKIENLLHRTDIFNIPVEDGSDKRLIDNMVQAALTSLEPEALRVVQALAVYDQPVPDVAVEYLLEPFQSIFVTRAHLEKLVRSYAISYDNDRYSLHPIDQKFAYDSLPDTVSLPDSVSLFDRWAAEQADRLFDDGPPPFTRAVLADRAGDYFDSIKLTSDKWKTIEDLETQFSEYEQRMKAKNYDKAARVVRAIDFDYLKKWGYAQRIIALREPLIDKLEDEDLIGNNYWLMALAYQDLGQVRKCIEYNEKTLEIYEKRQQKEDVERILGNIGLAYSDLGDYERAIEYHQQAITIAREMGYPEREIVSLRRMGSDLLGLSRIPEAIQHYQQALALARNTNDPKQEAGALIDLGKAHRGLGDLLQEIPYFEEALQIARNLNDKDLQAQTLNELGLVHVNLGQIQKAITYYQLAIANVRQIGKRPDEIVYLSNLGNAYAELRDFARAIQHHEKALELVRETGKRRDEAFRIQAIAGVYSLQGKMQQAVYHTQQALSIIREVGDRDNESSLLNDLGRYSLQLGNIAAARDYFDEGLLLVRNVVKNRLSEADFLGNLGRLAQYQMDLQQAEAYWQAALDLSKVGGNLWMQCLIYLYLGTAKLSEGRFAAARSDLEEAYRLAEQTQQYLYLYYAKVNLAAVYLFQNDIPMAFDLMQAAFQLDFSGKENQESLIIMGIVQLKLGTMTEAERYFKLALQQVNEFIADEADYYDLWYVKGLSLAGLACLSVTDTRYLLEAETAYQKALSIYVCPRTIKDHLQYLGVLHSTRDLTALRLILSSVSR